MSTVPLSAVLDEVVSLRPVARHSQTEYALSLLEHIWPGIEWLDIGCGRQVVPDWVWSADEARGLLQDTNLTGLDMDDAINQHPLLKKRLHCWAEDIPVADGSFDLVTSNMMMEHVKHPGSVLREIWRVLRPGGSFLIHTVNLHFYLTRIARYVPQCIKNRIIYWLERREAKDVFPTLYRFNTAESIEQCAAESGFDVVSVRFTGPAPSFLNTPFERLERPILALLRRPEYERYRPNLLLDLQKPKN